MAHTHRTSDGRETSLDVVDPEDATNHWHTVAGEKTGISEYGKSHSHIFAGIATTGQIEDDQQSKSFTKFQVTETKQTTDSNGIPVGIVEGYIATWDLDRGDWTGVKDRFVRGAFRESIADLKSRDRNLRLKDHHGRTIGNFPIQTVFEDDRGLFGTGHINLDVQQGKEAYSLALQKSLTDFSVGFSADEWTMEDDTRIITKATAWEGSIVDEPMNPAAQVTNVKNKIDSEQLEKMTERELEKALIEGGFSKSAARKVVFKKKGNSDVLEAIQAINKSEQKSRNEEILKSLEQIKSKISA